MRDQNPREDTAEKWTDKGWHEQRHGTGGKQEKKKNKVKKKNSPTSRTKWDHNTSEPFLLREQCVYLEANQITSAEWAAAISQSQPPSLTSVAQLDPNREFEQPRKKKKKTRPKPFLLEIKTLSNQTLTSVFQFRLRYRLLLVGELKCSRYNLASSREHKSTAGNLRRSRNSRCPYQEACSIWLMSELQRA